MSNTDDITDQEKIIDRLISEVRGYRQTLDNIKSIVYRTGPDVEKLTVAGAIRNLIRDNKELKTEVKELNKELNKSLKGRK